MSQSFKSLEGRRILITKPVRKESLIELSPEASASLDADAMKSWTNLEIYAVGEEVTKYKAGDKVYLSTSALQSAEILEVDGALRLMVSDYDIAIVW
jgi:hypothetical protein